MSKTFLKVGVPLMCAVPAAAGVVMMAELVTSEFRGNTGVEAELGRIYDSGTFSTNGLGEESKPYFQLYGDWIPAGELLPHDPFVDVEGELPELNGVKWLTVDNITNINVFPYKLDGNKPRPEKGYRTYLFDFSIETTGVDASYAAEGDTLGFLLDMTIFNEKTQKTEWIKNIPVSLTHVIEQK